MAPTAETPAPPLVGWTGLLFVIGSALFMLGVPLSLTTALPALASAATFTVGAGFFTTAALLQLLLARRDLPESAGRTIVFWRGKTSDWSSAAVQLVGTLAFNANTIRAAILIGADPRAVDREVWGPDAVGSALFLVASVIAMVPEVRERRHAHVTTRSLTIGTLNLTGSILFGLSAIGAYIIIGTGEHVSLVWANGGTFFGAACFLVGAALFGWPPRVTATTGPGRGASRATS